MRKSFKKGLAMVLAAAMVFSTPVAVGRTVAGAAETQLPKVVYSYDFEGESPLQSKGTVAGAESAIALVKDNGTVEVVKDGENSVLKVSDGGTESFGKNYAKLPAGLFKDVTAEDGLTLSMKVKIDKEKNSEWSTIFSSTPAVYNEWNLFKMNANLAADVNGGDPQAWGGTGSAGTDHFGDWHVVTVTVSKDKITTYLDGIEKLSGTVNADSPAGKAEGVGFSSMIGQIAKNQFNVLGCGGFPDSGKTGDKDISEILYDDIKVYNNALDTFQVYKVATGKDISEIVPVSVTGGAVSVKEGGKLAFDFKVNDYQEKGIPVAVNDKITVATGSALTVDEDGNATYVYDTEGKDGKYTFAVASTITDEGVLYSLTGVAKAEITLVKVGETMYVEDRSLITKDLSVAENGNTFTISWENAAGATAKAVVTGPDGKVVKELTASGSVAVSAAGNYDIALTVTKDGKIATAVSGFSYRPAGNASTTDKFSKVTSAKPIFKSTFDTADSAKNDGATLSAKASVKDGVLVLAPDTKQKGQYYAQLPSFATKDFSKGITFIADVNVAAWETTWTPFVVFGDGTPASDASTATFRWAFDVGFDSIAGTKEVTAANAAASVKDGWHTAGGAVGYYGNDSTAPMATGYSYDFFSKAENQKKWYTVAVTVNKTDMTTYVNGVQIQTKKGDFTKLFDGMKKASKNYLGTSYWTGDPDLAGSMDDVAVYNTALSAADIKTLTRTDAAGNGGGQTVTTPTAKVSKVTIKVPNKKSGKTIYMKVKDKLTLKATVKGTGKYSKSVTWKSSKKKVASVTSKGKVTAKKAGTAKITATSKTDKKKKATITIKVSKKAVKNKTLKLKATKKTLKKGKTYTIGIKKITKKTTEKITYKTSKKSVATVDAYGVVKAKKKGTAKITVKCGKKKATLKLTVKK